MNDARADILEKCVNPGSMAIVQIKGITCVAQIVDGVAYAGRTKYARLDEEGTLRVTTARRVDASTQREAFDIAGNLDYQHKWQT